MKPSYQSGTASNNRHAEFHLVVDIHEVVIQIDYFKISRKLKISFNDKENKLIELKG